ncbi:YhjD/YihY/BrkB family envelope integrity protein [Luteolibacter marinus]|uniref:YhjD/YihY/BrkB family envelope integrity protein n=1 Tax=Luteolibacter marinus TaxID=2776705 RepID=UPI00186890A5
MYRRRRLRAILVVRKFTRRWVQHRHTDNAAALAFYALISLPPLLLIGVTVAGMVLGERAAHGELESRFTSLLGAELAGSIESIIQAARIAPSSNPWAFVVAMVTLFFAGSHVLTKLRKTLNVVNEAAPADPARRWLGRLAARGLCSGLILVFGILLAAGTLLDGFSAYVAARMEAPWLQDLNLLQRMGWLSTYLLLTFAFGLIMKVLPRRRPWWRHAMIGAAFAALVAVSLKGGLDIYVRHSLWRSFVGGGLNFLLFLFWLFVSIQAFLAGAEIAAALGRGRKNQSAPNSRAASQ